MYKIDSKGTKVQQTIKGRSPYHVGVMKGASPYFHRGGRVGVLCLHGFTASPHEMLWLGQHLASEGYTVFAPRLAGHGTRPRDLARSLWIDWLHSALDGYDILRQQCDQVFVAGLSMGGTLALLLSTYVAVEGVIAMAAPLQPYPKLGPRRLRILKRLRPYTDHTDRSAFEAYVRQQQAERGEPITGRARYTLWPTAAVEQLMRLIPVVIVRLPQVTAPTLLLYSNVDLTVNVASLNVALESIASTDVEHHTFETSGHVLTQDHEHREVFKRVSNFIADRAQRSNIELNSSLSVENQTSFSD
jgi:carboxylesterase